MLFMVSFGAKAQTREVALWRSRYTRLDIYTRGKWKLCRKKKDVESKSCMVAPHVYYGGCVCMVVVLPMIIPACLMGHPTEKKKKEVATSWPNVIQKKKERKKLTCSMFGILQDDLAAHSIKDKRSFGWHKSVYWQPRQDVGFIWDHCVSFSVN